MGPFRSLRAADLRALSQPDVELVPAVWLPPAGVSCGQWPEPAELDEPLVCCICGVSTPAKGATHHVVPSWSRFAYPAGRFCATCSRANRSQPSAIVEGLVDPADPAADAVMRSLRRFHDLGDWTTPWLPGYAERWAFVDRSAVAEVVEETHAARAPKPNHAGRGCGGCGVARAVGWQGELMTRTSQHRPLCLVCGGLLGSVGAIGPRFDDVLAAHAAGLSSSPMEEGFAARVGFRPHAMCRPDDPGSPAPFEWLGEDLERLREWSAERWPGLVIGADPAQERARVQSEQRAALRARVERQTSALTLDAERGGSQ